jgi:hypothetical protein
MSVRQRAEHRIPKLKAMLLSETSLRLKPHLWGKMERRKRHEAALSRCEYIVAKARFKRRNRRAAPLDAAAGARTPLRVLISVYHNQLPPWGR